VFGSGIRASSHAVGVVINFRTILYCSCSGVLVCPVVGDGLNNVVLVYRSFVAICFLLLISVRLSIYFFVACLFFWVTVLDILYPFRSCDIHVVVLVSLLDFCFLMLGVLIRPFLGAHSRVSECSESCFLVQRAVSCSLSFAVRSGSRVSGCR